MIKASIIADSAYGDSRLTSFILVYPRFIHSEIMTHRKCSRNAASSRAIPIDRMIGTVSSNPARPVHWGSNQPGMQAGKELQGDALLEAIKIWDDASISACAFAYKLSRAGVHKQIANRVLEPFAHMTTLVTASDFGNFFALRAHKDAQPEFQCLAWKMLEAYVESVPETLRSNQWHMPFRDKMPEGSDTETKLKIATARAARLSYDSFDGPSSPEKDIALHDSLRDAGHWSPFEHCAYPHWPKDGRGGNFGYPWVQYRKLFKNEVRSIDFVEHLKGKVTFPNEHCLD